MGATASKASPKFHTEKSDHDVAKRSSYNSDDQLFLTDAVYTVTTHRITKSDVAIDN